MPRRKRGLPWTTRADNRKTLEDFSIKADLISKREAIRKNEEESAVYDYAAARARNEVQHIDREQEGLKAALASTKIPAAPLVAEAIYHGAPVTPVDTGAFVQDGRNIFNDNSNVQAPRETINDISNVQTPRETINDISNVQTPRDTINKDSE